MTIRFISASTLRLLIILAFMAGALSTPLQSVSAQPLLQGSIGCDGPTGIPKEECDALTALYNSTDGPNWTNKRNWLDFNIHTPCSWYGVTCEFGHVISLDLYNNQLTGTIPPELGSLTNLTFLDLSSNQLTGPIPAELGSLTNLAVLDLCNNQLSGSIPPELGSLTNLKRLYLMNNQLSGAIPPELGSLTNLLNLILNMNQLSGTIPAELGNMTNLLMVNLSYNQLTGTIPAELGNMTNLQTLNLSANQLTGTIPPELGSLTNLYFLQLNNNQLSGPIPAELGSLTNLAVLDLCNNQLSGSIPPELGSLTRLQYLDFSTNQLSGAIPPELGDLPNLWGLVLGNNQLNGTIPPELGNLSVLQILNLSSNQLTGIIPLVLGDLSDLVDLNLGSNRLTGSIPPGLINLTKLESLNLSSNQLTGTIPAGVGYLTDLMELNLGSNHLKGAIPLTLTQLAELETLYLYANQLTGIIPPELGSLTKLTKLNFSSNQLTGPIPPELGSLTSLTLLQLKSNRLSGAIPASITDLTALNTLLFDFCNGLGSSDPEVIAFLNDKADGWNACDSQTISGNAGTGNASLSYTNGTLKTAAADADGDYSFTVPYFWSGTVTPDKLDFYFTPLSKTYTQVFADQTAQNYTASTTAFTISGNAGVNNAILSYTDGTLKTANADADGKYSFHVSDNWSGTVTPSMAGYIFAPINKSYTDVTADQTDQNYTATAVTYTISGKAGTGDVILSYTDGTLKTAAADANGDYSFQVPYNWSGTVTPSKAGFVFLPVKKTYAQVFANQTAQNYTARNIIAISTTAEQDGWVLESNEFSKAGGSLNAAAPTLRLGDDMLNKQYRGILSFNTSDLPDNAVITKVTLKIKKHSVTGDGDPMTTFQGFMVDIKKGVFGTAALQTTDFQAPASKSYGPFKPARASGWYTINLTGGKASINKLEANSGLTQLRLSFKLDDNNNAIANTLNLYSGDAPAESRPRLVIQYYVP